MFSEPPPVVRVLTRRLLSATTLGATLSLLGVVLGAGVQACGDDKDGTGGRRVVLHTRFALSESARAEFQTAAGWTVTLTKALVSAGPFYYFDGTPPLVVHERQDPWRFAARVLGLASARAHPGHYQAGNAMGQMLGSVSIDLLGGGVQLPDGAGISGVYRSARFTFSEPSGRGASALEGHVALAVGKAEKHRENPRFFRAFADLNAIEKSATRGQIEGCELTEVDVEHDGTVTVTVDPSVWFNLVDFDDAEEGSADMPADLPEGSQPELAFVLGTTQLSAYKFSYAEP